MQKEKVLNISGIEVAVTKKPKQKNMYVRVCPPNGCVKVSAPAFISDKQICAFVTKKLPQIKKWQEKVRAQQNQKQHSYSSGDKFYLFGRPLLLQVVQSTSNKMSIQQFPAKIMLSAPKSASTKAREKKINAWYKEKLQSAIESMSPALEKRTGVSASEYRVKNMKTRWGSCNTKCGRIWISLQLATKPPECLEYVLIHELCHLIEPNHSARFWAHVKKFCPEYEITKAKLDTSNE